MSASACCRSNAANTASISASVLAWTTMSFFLSPSAATCASRVSSFARGLVGLMRNAMVAAAGTTSCKRPSALAPSVLFRKLDSCEVAPRPCEVLDQLGRHRIARGREDNRDGCCRRLDCKCRRSSTCHNHRHLASNQIGGRGRQPIVLIVSPAIFDRHVATLDISELFQAELECGNQIAPHLGEPLCRNPITGIVACCPRAASGHAAAPPSSVMNCRRLIRSPRRRGQAALRGTSRPSAFAVLRLITSSYLVGACTGRSAGFSPLRMRSTYPAARRYGSIVSAP